MMDETIDHETIDLEPLLGATGGSSTGIQGETNNPNQLMMRIGEMNIYVKHGDITLEKTDAIVNSTNFELNLTHGAVSKAILEAAGPSIKYECEKLGRPKDGLVVTGAGNLPCGRIIHLVAPFHIWSSWKKAIKKALNKADEKEFTSLAFPAIGTGQMKQSAATIAKNMIEAIIEFDKEHKTSNLTLVVIVVFQRDMVPVFHAEMQKRLEDVKNTGYFKRLVYNTNGDIVKAERRLVLTIGSVNLEVEEGDITKETTDGIVNITNDKMNLKHGQVSKAILNAAGDMLQTECTNCVENGISNGIAITGPGNLKCRQIIHLIAPSFWSSWTNPIKMVLEQAEKLEFRSVTFPAIETGLIGKSPSTIAKNMLDAIENFVQYRPPSHRHLSKVRIVIFKQEMLPIFHHEMRCRATSKSKFCCRFLDYEELDLSESKYSLPPPLNRPNCMYRDLCNRFKETLKLERSFFNPTYDTCYCEKCHEYRKDTEEFLHSGMAYHWPGADLL